MPHTMEIRVQLWSWFSSIFMWIPGTELGSLGLHGKCLYLLSHFADPKIFLFIGQKVLKKSEDIFILKIYFLCFFFYIYILNKENVTCNL